MIVEVFNFGFKLRLQVGKLGVGLLLFFHLVLSRLHFETVEQALQVGDLLVEDLDLNTVDPSCLGFVLLFFKQRLSKLDILVQSVDLFSV